jgi:arylsulfatase A-like enzyme
MQTAPSKGAPNVLLIMIDDEGFGAPSTFGGLIPKPTMYRIAKMGLRYTALHTTALCSPTRAAVLPHLLALPTRKHPPLFCW